MVDEFVYQFQSYCQYKHKLKAKTEEEMARILGSPAVRDRCGRSFLIRGIRFGPHRMS